MRQKDLSVSQIYGHEYDLQQIALDFLDKSYIYPLNDTTFPSFPGVYLIYYVGKTQLYEGSQVLPSTDYPVYVGMSMDKISRRLKSHHKNITDAIGEQTGEEKQTDEEQREKEQEEKRAAEEQEEHTEEEQEQTEEERVQEEQTEEVQEEQREEERVQEEHPEEELKEQREEEQTGGNC